MTDDATEDADGGTDGDDMDASVGTEEAVSTPEPDAQSTETTEPTFTVDDFYRAVEAEGRPVVTAQQVARRTDRSHAEATDALSALERAGTVKSVDVETDPVVWYPSQWGDLATRERIVLFPQRREVVVDAPTQYTRARMAQFAHLVDTTGDRGAGTRGYLYRLRREDIWGAPFESLGELLAIVRSVLPHRSEPLEEWIGDQWRRAHQFTLSTHEDGYTVLSAASESLMGNVAQQELDEEHLHAPISETDAWVREGSEAAIKRILWEAGYPVIDERELEVGDPIDVDLHVELRDYQREWVETFMQKRAGVLVGPPGSGKTIAGMGVLEAVGGETLVLVPSRELAVQWREELLRHTSLSEEEIGEYHGGTKQIRPVTIATYQTAGMDRHRSLFDSRKWGLIIYDEVHHIPSRVYRRSADLQAKHRLGLSATPVRESDDEREIFTLIGPPIGTDWTKLFDAGYVQEPEVEIRYVPWRDDDAQNEYAAADGRDRHTIAAMNPAKVDEIRYLLAQHDDAKALVFVDWLDQGDDISGVLDVPFVSGDTPHWERERLFERFREGELRTLVVSRIADEGIDLPNAELAIVASGLGGSRRQGAQRAGRTMRPAGSALVYVLATRGTTEEEFAQRQMRHLAEKGVLVRENDLA